MDRKPPPEDEFPEITFEPGSEGVLRHIPTLHYWNKTYGVSLGGNDHKAAHVFRNYEAEERTRRLQSELISIKEGRVADEVLNVVVGKKRKMKYGGYDKWAALM